MKPVLAYDAFLSPSLLKSSRDAPATECLQPWPGCRPTPALHILSCARWVGLHNCRHGLSLPRHFGHQLSRGCRTTEALRLLLCARWVVLHFLLTLYMALVSANIFFIKATAQVAWPAYRAPSAPFKRIILSVKTSGRNPPSFFLSFSNSPLS